MNDTRQALEKDVRDNLLLLYDFDKDYDVKLLKYSENVIFKITFKEAFPVVFRIHRPGVSQYRRTGRRNIMDGRNPP